MKYLLVFVNLPVLPGRQIGSSSLHFAPSVVAMHVEEAAPTRVKPTLQKNSHTLPTALPLQSMSECLGVSNGFSHTIAEIIFWLNPVLFNQTGKQITGFVCYEGHIPKNFLV